MYAGHIGIALGAKRVRPEIPLWLLVLAAQGCDWADFLVGDLARVPDYVLWTHSLPAALAGGLVVGAVGFALHRSPGVALLLLGVYLSHPLVDYLTGLKPTWPGGPWIGLELYERAAWDFVVEVVILVIGWSLYRGTLPLRARRAGLAYALLFSLAGMQLAADAGFALRNSILESRVEGTPFPPVTAWVVRQLERLGIRI